jgi:hypothetical protein
MLYRRITVGHLATAVSQRKYDYLGLLDGRLLMLKSRFAVGFS